LRVVPNTLPSKPLAPRAVPEFALDRPKAVPRLWLDRARHESTTAGRFSMLDPYRIAPALALVTLALPSGRDDNGAMQSLGTALDGSARGPIVRERA